jgi:hypothetical protein
VLDIAEIILKNPSMGRDVCPKSALQVFLAKKFAVYIMFRLFVVNYFLPEAVYRADMVS